MSTESLVSSFIADLREMSAEAHAVTYDPVDNIAREAGLPDRIPLAIRHGKTPEIIDLRPLFEAWRGRPATKRGTATALTLESFIGLTNRHKTPHSTIFANTDWRKPSLLAVIDYHEKGATPVEGEIGEIAAGVDLIGETDVTYAPRPDNLKHRVNYAYPLSDDWKVWVEKNGQSFGQSEFASFIEDHIADLTSPTPEEKAWLEQDFETKVATPSDLLRLSRGLQINVESKVKNIVSLQSGAAQIQFEEVHSDSDGQPLTVPGIFLLAVAPFASGGRIRLPVRLRYRKQGGAIVWFYQMYRPDQFITERLRGDIFLVMEATELPIFEGTPETSA